MKVKVRKRSSKRNPAPVVTEQVSKENCQFLENKSKTISTTNIVRYEDAFDLMEIPLSMLPDFITANIYIKEDGSYAILVPKLWFGTTLIEIHSM